MANINTVTLAGNLTKAPEQRYAPNGTAVTRFGLAINHRYTQGKEVKEETCFIDVTVFGPQAVSGDLKLHEYRRRENAPFASWSSERERSLGIRFLRISCHSKGFCISRTSVAANSMPEKCDIFILPVL